MPFDPLPCDTIAFRAVVRKADIDWESRMVLAAAFIRRPNDDDGVSVNHNCAPEECGLDLAYKFAAASVHVGRVRDLNFDIIPDELTHANIVELVRKNEDPVLAERQADLIARGARIAFDNGGTKIHHR